eukprot:jgi/Picre1/32702/NNA_008047.t1
MASTEFGDEVTEEQMRWFLLDRKMQVDAAAEKLVKMKQQQAKPTFIPIMMSRRPVIVVRAAKHVKDAAPLLHSQQLCVYTLERALEKLPEGQDTVLGIFDLRGFQSRNADMGFVKFMVDIFFTYYPKRLEPGVVCRCTLDFQAWVGDDEAMVEKVCCLGSIRVC